MEEELNENELEERFYSMLYYVDDTQASVTTKDDATNFVETAPHSTMRRYWRTTSDILKDNNQNKTPHQKINTSKETPNTNKGTDDTKPKEEKQESTIKPLPAHLSIFQSPIPQNIKKTIEILEDDEDDDSKIVELESSDEDEVVEVALPPKPTITIESSDDDEHIETGQKSQAKTKAKMNSTLEKTCIIVDREISASPVPSVVSSISDEFIRSDCIALNISSQHPDDHSFDFSLHRNDLLGQGAPSKKKKRKKNKDVTATPIVAVVTPEKSVTNVVEECFATPKSKAKNKKQKPKSYSVSEKSIPNPDVYDSDSNQSNQDVNKNKNTYIITEKSLPSTDVYESDSNPFEAVKNSDSFKQNETEICLDTLQDLTPNNPKRSESVHTNNTSITVVDLTDNPLPSDDTDIYENIVIGNVSGLSNFDEIECGSQVLSSTQKDITKFGSTKVPAILYEDLDFDNLKGKDKVCKNRRYSLTTLRAEMEKFYNESWGGEDFNHREIQKNMSRDKSLWEIDPKDRMPSMSKRRLTCHYCNRPGHRDELCRNKPRVCFMCGADDHIEPRCPAKICVNCGAPNFMYSTICRNCANWGRIACAECHQYGHPSSHCPDIWRRYHNTIDLSAPLAENRYTKGHNQLFCSGCARRGHLVHTCRIAVPFFSGHIVNSPYVNFYNPLYAPVFTEDSCTFDDNNQRNNAPLYHRGGPQDSVSSDNLQVRNDRNKRLPKSPTDHESHVTKKRKMAAEGQSNIESSTLQRKISQNLENAETNKVSKEPDRTNTSSTSQHSSTDIDADKAPDFIPIGPTNRDKKGQIIQDNEVSDTSDVITSACIYVTNDVLSKLKTTEGEEWLKESMEKHNVAIEIDDIQSILNIKGKVEGQEAFQCALRNWNKVIPINEHPQFDNETGAAPDSGKTHCPSNDIPRKKNLVIRKISNALASLKGQLGDPNAIFKELNYQQNRHQKLLNEKVINAAQLSNGRRSINEALKKLNMILLGQAGLADGPTHLNELYLLQEKIINCRQKLISDTLRKEIGQHYHTIFAPNQRDDYDELLASYYDSKRVTMTWRKNNTNKSQKLPPMQKKMKVFQGLQKGFTPGKKSTVAGGDNVIPHDVRPKKPDPLVHQTRIRLVFYHRQLLKMTGPCDALLKKRRVALVRKLHSHIGILFRNANISSKTLKKIDKLQAQAQVFLRHT